MAQLSGKTILLVVSQKNYNEQEFQYLNDLCTAEGVSVEIASLQMDKALGRQEGYVVPHILLSEAKADDYDGIIIIGGYGAYTQLWDNPELHQLLQKANQSKKLIVAASVATVALANAGILEGKKATVYPDYNATVILQEKGAVHVYDSVVVDDNIITSNHGRQVEELGSTIISKLAEG